MKEITTKAKTGRSILKAILFCGLFTGLFILLSFLKSFFPQQFERLAHGAIGSFAALLTTFLFLKFDRKKFWEHWIKI